MSDERKKGRWLTLTAFAMLTLPPLHVLCVGPAMWATEHRWLSTEALQRGWRPVYRISLLEAVQPAAGWYARVWCRSGFDWHFVGPDLDVGFSSGP